MDSKDRLVELTSIQSEVVAIPPYDFGQGLAMISGPPLDLISLVVFVCRTGEVDM
jgi:hypothetical protein